MLQELGWKSERQADAREIRLLVRTIAVRGAALEARLLVAEEPLQVLVEIPVEAERGGGRFLHGRRGVCIRVGAANERIGVDRQLMDARDQLPRAVSRLAGREVRAGRGGAKRFLFT